MPRRSASARDVTTTAAAPSLIVEAFAAVTVPSFSNAGRSPAMRSNLTAHGPSSSLTTVTAPLRPGTSTGTISCAAAPLRVASCARR